MKENEGRKKEERRRKIEKGKRTAVELNSGFGSTH
jgi:hypothetical protein